MKRLRLLVAPLAATLLAATASAQPAADPAAVQRIRADVEFLASDLLEGRDTGSRGYDIAAAYVVSELKSIGLQPAGEKGTWLQQVPFRHASHAAPAEAALVTGNGATKLVIGRDFQARPSLTQQVRSLEAPLVFVGHAISDPRAGVDDYAGLDVRGKIVVALEGSPKALPSEVAAHLGSSKAATAAAKGAVGLIEIAGTGNHGNRLRQYAAPVIDWVGSGGRVNQNARLALLATISKDVAGRLFKGARMSFGEARAAAERRQSSAVALPANLRLSDRSAWRDFTSPEVVGLLPGSDPVLKDEYVVLMGHLDHLGIKTDAKPGEDAIYNGALDNAGGIATMLEAARQFASSGQRPKRSVLFIANTGEEKGLRGADYFAANPTVPIDRIVGLVNLDMPLLLYDFKDVIAFGADHSTVAVAVAEAGRSMGVAVAPDPMPEQSLFTRSDHYRFVQRGVPSVFLMTGYANGGEPAWKKFLADEYHSPQDDLSQPINWTAAARFAEFNYRIARTLANAPQRPLWYRGSYFGETFAPGQPRAER